MIYGYARVSKNEQNLDLQIDDLLKANCDQIFQEKITGVSLSPPEWNKLVKMLRPGDTVITWDIDRLGRKTVELIQLIENWYEQGIFYKSLQEGYIDTSSDNGILVFQLFSVLAGHERRRLINRTNAGIKAAKARGRVGGRPKGLDEEQQRIARIVKQMAADEEYSIVEISKKMNLSRPTVYKYISIELDEPKRKQGDKKVNIEVAVKK